jgi:hypothetical protein
MSAQPHALCSHHVQEQLERSVLPLFVQHEMRLNRPRRCGSCVLVRLLDRFFLVTAKHNLCVGRDGEVIDGRTIHLGRASKLFTFPIHGFYASENLDVAVALLNQDQVSELIDRGFGFVVEPSVKADATESSEPSHVNSYIVFGWPESGSQSHLDPTRKKIKQPPFTFCTRISDRELIACEGFNPESHLFLEFDPSCVRLGRVRQRPPDPVGISGGPAFHLVDGVMTLAGIMIEHVRSSQVMVAVRMSEVVALARYAVQR